MMAPQKRAYPVNTQTATFSPGILAVKNVGMVEGHAAWI